MAYVLQGPLKYSSESPRANHASERDIPHVDHSNGWIIEEVLRTSARSENVKVSNGIVVEVGGIVVPRA